MVDLNSDNLISIQYTNPNVQVAERTSVAMRNHWAYFHSPTGFVLCFPQKASSCIVC